MLPKEHRHLFETAKKQILCTCEACGLLFSRRPDGSGFLAIPRTIRRLDAFQISDWEWQGLRLPIDLAFFLRSTEAERVVAYYPSPAGSTESLLPLEAWSDLVAGNPVLEQMAPDVEALLVNRTGGLREYYLAPLDECYKLTGMIRTHWRGLSGGDAAWREIAAFFDSLRERAVSPSASGERVHA